MYLVVPQFRAFSPSLPLPRISEEQALFLFIPKATCERTGKQTDRQCVSSKTFRRHAGEQADRQTDNMYRARRFDDIEIAYLFIPYLLLFIPSTYCCCSFSSSSGSVGGEVILQRWRGFLSLVGEFETWCVCKRYLFAQRKSVELRGGQPFILVSLWNGKSARALSLSLCV